MDTIHINESGEAVPGKQDERRSKLFKERINNAQKSAAKADSNRERISRFIDPDYAPHRVKNRKAFGGNSGQSYDKWKNTSKAHHKRRAAEFAGFSPSGRSEIKEGMLNSVGILSSQQKAAAKKPGFFNQMDKFIVPLAAGAFVLESGMSGDSFVDFLAGYAGLTIGGQLGWRVGKELGYGVGSSAGALSMGKIVGKGALGLVGGVAGMATGAFAVSAAIGSISAATDSDNAAKRLQSKYAHADFVNKDMDITRNTITARQKAMQQLSRSSLNNRGQLLGNEAMIIAGVR